MSNVNTKFRKTGKSFKSNLSWNSCEDKLKECIKRNRFVKDTRKRLAKKKIKQLKQISGN